MKGLLGPMVRLDVNVLGGAVRVTKTSLVVGGQVAYVLPFPGPVIAGASCFSVSVLHGLFYFPYSSQYCGLVILFHKYLANTNPSSL